VSTGRGQGQATDGGRCSTPSRARTETLSSSATSTSTPSLPPTSKRNSSMRTTPIRLCISKYLRISTIFAVTFVMRPVSAWFFGPYADRRGRKAALVCPSECHPKSAPESREGGIPIVLELLRSSSTRARSPQAGVPTTAARRRRGA
jgi:hypothetical protein